MISKSFLVVRYFLNKQKEQTAMDVVDDLRCRRGREVWDCFLTQIQEKRTSILIWLMTYIRGEVSLLFITLSTCGRLRNAIHLFLVLLFYYKQNQLNTKIIILHFFFLFYTSVFFFLAFSFQNEKLEKSCLIIRNGKFLNLIMNKYFGKFN